MVIVMLLLLLVMNLFNTAEDKDTVTEYETTHSTSNGEYNGLFDEKKFQESTYQFIISNQSFEVPSIKLTCYIDDKEIFSDTYHVLDQHEYSYYYFDLQAGTYELVIESENGETMRERITLTESQEYAYITYWGDGDNETINYITSSQPIGLD